MYIVEKDIFYLINKSDYFIINKTFDYNIKTFNIRNKILNKLLKYREYNYFHIHDLLKSIDLFDYIIINNKIDSIDIKSILLICLFISVKFNDDLYTFDLESINKLLDYKFDIDYLLNLERKIFKIINCKINFPTLYQLNIYLNSFFELDEQNKILTNYLIECSLLSKNLVFYKKYLISISIIILSQVIINEKYNNKFIYDLVIYKYKKLLLKNIITFNNFNDNIKNITKIIINILNNLERKYLIFNYKNNTVKYYNKNNIFIKYNLKNKIINLLKKINKFF